MFLEHYGFTDEPFGATSDTFLFLPWRSRRMLALFLAAGAAKCLGVVPGATRKTALPHSLDAPPSVESTVFPAPVLSPVVPERP